MSVHSFGDEHELDVRFLGRMIDEDEVYILREQSRLGCPLRIVDNLKLRLEHKQPLEANEVPIKVDVVGEGELAAEQLDFRDLLDEPDHKPWFEIRGDELIAHGCIPEVAMLLQELIGFVNAVVEAGKEVYDLFFPAECLDAVRELDFAT
jgi:hypothetical protein